MLLLENQVYLKADGDLEYEMESLSEANVLSADVGQWVELFAEPDDIAHLMRESQRVHREVHALGKDTYFDKIDVISDVYDREYDYWLTMRLHDYQNGADPQILAPVIHCALAGMHKLMSMPKDLARNIYHELLWVRKPHLTSSWVEGYNFKIVDWMSVHRGPPKPTPKYLRRLHSVSYIKRALRAAPRERVTSLAIARMKTALTRWSKVFKVLGPLLFNEQIIEDYNTNRQMLMDLMRRNSAARTASLSMWWERRSGKPSKREKKRVRKAVQRSMAVLQKFLEPAEIDKFRKRQAVIMDVDDEWALEVSLSDIWKDNYQSVRRVLIDKVQDKAVAELCVYFKETPAPEQLLGFWLNSKTGQLGEVLTDANTHQVFDPEALNRFRDKYPRPQPKITHRIPRQAGNTRPMTWTLIGDTGSATSAWMANHTYTTNNTITTGTSTANIYALTNMVNSTTNGNYYVTTQGSTYALTPVVLENLQSDHHQDRWRRYEDSVKRIIEQAIIGSFNPKMQRFLEHNRPMADDADEWVQSTITDQVAQ